MTKNGSVSTEEVYELVNDTRKELARSILGVEDKVDSVTRDVANIQGKITVIAAIISLSISVFFLIIQLLLKR